MSAVREGGGWNRGEILVVEAFLWPGGGGGGGCTVWIFCVMRSLQIRTSALFCAKT